MTNKNKLAYVTYQSFPAETANSLQSITNIVELAKQGIDVELVFPKRENTCSDDIEKLKVLSGVKKFPSRVKCAIMSWNAVRSALEV